MLKFNIPPYAKNPVLNKRVSPGKKNPISRPDSAKIISATINTTNQEPVVPARCIRSNPGITHPILAC